jgi:hypothetical protein
MYICIHKSYASHVFETDRKHSTSHLSMKLSMPIVFLLLCPLLLSIHLWSSTRQSSSSKLAGRALGCALVSGADAQQVALGLAVMYLLVHGKQHEGNAGKTSPNGAGVSISPHSAFSV